MDTHSGDVEQQCPQRRALNISLTTAVQWAFRCNSIAHAGWVILQSLH